jgi:hypothetical protein
MHLAEFKPAIPEIKRLQKYALDRTATGISQAVHYFSHMLGRFAFLYLCSL